MSDVPPSGNRIHPGLAIVGVIFLVAAGLLFYYRYREDQAHERGPLQTTAAAVASAADPSALPGSWVTFRPTKVIETGVKRTVRRKYAPPAVFKYVLVQVEDKFLVTEVREGRSVAPPSVEGHMEKWAAQAKDGVVGEIYGKVPMVRDKLVPFQMDTFRDVEGYSNLMAVAAGVLVAVGCGFLATGAVRRSSGPAKPWERSQYE